MPTNNSFQRLSSSIDSIRFPLMLSIIFIHAYIAVPIPEHQTYYRLIYPFSLWMGETGVPGFFFISGLWFFYSQKNYSTKIKDRVHTLVIPYLIWNSLFLLGFIFAYAIGYNREIFMGRGIADYNFFDYIRAYWDRGDFDSGNFKPIYPPMWYLRNLMILCILSPIIKYIIQKTGLVLPIIIGIIWCFTYNEGLIYESISAFCLGAYFPICNVNIINILDKYKKQLTIILITLAISDFLTHSIISFQYNLQIHRLAIFTNILCFPIIGEYLYKHKLYNKTLSKMSFFIYCIHLPIVTIIRKPALWHPELSSLTHIILYFASLIAITIICIFIYKLFSLVFPSIMGLATGNRKNI